MGHIGLLVEVCPTSQILASASLKIYFFILIFLAGLYTGFYNYRGPKIDLARGFQRYALLRIFSFPYVHFKMFEKMGNNSFKTMSVGSSINYMSIPVVPLSSQSPSPFPFPSGLVYTWY